MKLRMKINSIRLRLTQTEAARFAATGLFEEAIKFGLQSYQQFVYALKK